MDFSRIRRAAVLTIIALLSRATVCATQKATQLTMPKFTELSSDDIARLDQQRAIVEAAAKQRYGTFALTKTLDDLPVLQRRDG
jgi:hypothetical protein